MNQNVYFFVFFFQAEDGIRYRTVTGVQTGALPIAPTSPNASSVGTSERSRPGKAAKKTIAEIAIPSALPLLCAASETARRATPAAKARLRAAAGAARCEARTTAGQKPTRRIAGCAFAYAIGKSRRPEM